MYIKFRNSGVNRDLTDVSHYLNLDTSELELLGESEGHVNGYFSSAITFYSDECEDDDTVIATMEIRAYSLRAYGVNLADNKEDTFSVSYLDEVMSEQDSDNSHYFAVFEDNYDEMISSVSEADIEELAFWNDDTYLICLHKFVVNPEYRGKGIAVALLKNLRYICKHCFNILPVVLVGTCVPNANEPEGMKEIQMKTFKKAGCVVTDNGDFCGWID